MKSPRFGTQKRFLISGIINTLIGVLVILFFQLLLGNPYFANILGYIFGGAVGYLTHTGYTFKARFSKRNFVGYTLIWLTGVGFNLLLLKFLIVYVHPLLAQCVAVGFFISYSYYLQAKIVYR
jgi:putative flippase GtrA